MFHTTLLSLFLLFSRIMCCYFQFSVVSITKCQPCQRHRSDRCLSNYGWGIITSTDGSQASVDVIDSHGPCSPCESVGKIDKMQLTRLPLVTFPLQSWSHLGINIYQDVYTKLYYNVRPLHKMWPLPIKVNMKYLSWFFCHSVYDSLTLSLTPFIPLMSKYWI